MRCPVDPTARYIDGPPFRDIGNGDVLQCYNSPDAEALDFCELEAHAPAARLSPGETTESEEEILLFKDELATLTRVTGTLLGEKIDSSRLFLESQ